jgi:hypothetical protein
MLLPYYQSLGTPAKLLLNVNDNAVVGGYAAATDHPSAIAELGARWSRASLTVPPDLTVFAAHGAAELHAPVHDIWPNL